MFHIFTVQTTELIVAVFPRSFHVTNVAHLQFILIYHVTDLDYIQDFALTCMFVK